MLRGIHQCPSSRDNIYQTPLIFPPFRSMHFFAYMCKREPGNKVDITYCVRCGIVDA